MNMTLSSMYTYCSTDITSTNKAAQQRKQIKFFTYNLLEFANKENNSVNYTISDSSWECKTGTFNKSVVCKKGRYSRYSIA